MDYTRNMKKLSLEELHYIQLDMMCEFDRFCKKNQIRYYLAFGTLIGAIRHNGFIPWDDDVDIIIPRPDFEKLITMKQINERYDIVSNKYPNGYYHPFLHANITDKHTIMDEHDMINSTGKGVFIDLFPLDGLPDKASRIKSHCKSLQFMNAILSYTIANETKSKTTVGKVKNLAKRICRHTLSSQRIINSIQNKAMKYEFEKSNYVAVSASMPTFLPYDHLVFSKDLFQPSLHEFEGYKFCIPAGYHENLTSLYGDYMTPPPVDKQTYKHDIVYYWRGNNEGNQ